METYPGLCDVCITFYLLHFFVLVPASSISATSLHCREPAEKQSHHLVSVYTGVINVKRLILSLQVSSFHSMQNTFIGPI
jgi:hypothetical protein